jgi:glutathione synthase/RimK-type ligase-like ATP-grasp enzyme
MYLYCNRPSKSAYNLAKGLGVKRLRKGIFANYGEEIINWGCTEFPDETYELIVNPPYAVKQVSNKLKFFELMQGTGLTPTYYTNVYGNKLIASYEKTYPIVCRTVLNGHSGKGIVLSNSLEELVEAPLYVEYKKKKYEFRIHIMNGEVIDIQQKKRRLEVDREAVNWQIRNHKNGWCYAREIDPGLRHKVIECERYAKTAMFMTNLDFGAVDVIWSAEDNRPYVLEINTAPGLEGKTLDIYVKAIREHYGNMR